MKSYCDIDHAGEKITRRSRYGFFMVLNMNHIYWFSKNQTRVETSTFRSKFVAMEHCCEYIMGMLYNLWMMVIPVENFFCLLR